MPHVELPQAEFKVRLTTTHVFDSARFRHFSNRLFVGFDEPYVPIVISPNHAIYSN